MITCRDVPSAALSRVWSSTVSRSCGRARPRNPVVPAGTAAARGPRQTRMSGTRGGESSPTSLGTAMTVITACSRRRIRSDASHRSPVPATGHSRGCTPPPSRTSYVWPCHCTCRTLSSAHTTSGGSVSRARSSAGSRGCHTRTTSWPSGSPPAAYCAAARLRLPGSSACQRAAIVSRPAADRSASVTDGSPCGFPRLPPRTSRSQAGRGQASRSYAAIQPEADDGRPIMSRETAASQIAPGYPSAQPIAAPIRSPL